MKIDFTYKQYRELIQLLKFNMEFFKKADKADYKEYLSLIQYILDQEKLFKTIEMKSDEDGRDELEDDERLILFKESYDEAVFWEGLCRRMVAEELFEECEELDLDNIEEYAEKRRTLEEALLERFKSGEFSIRETER